MKYKLFSIDLDGTLLSKTKRISKKNISALVEYKKNGGEIVIATGRSIISAMKYVNKLNNFNLDIKYLITFNGAKIINLKDKNEINTTISHNVVAKVVNAIKEFNCAA
jgi:HAD superfamily hydrolase (TIGR01484 family)